VKSYDNILGLVLSVLVIAYLIYALVAPEKL
jgi:K+-transporting ATPase KdpF subunit